MPLKSSSYKLPLVEVIFSFPWLYNAVTEIIIIHYETFVVGSCGLKLKSEETISDGFELVFTTLC